MLLRDFCVHIMLKSLYLVLSGNSGNKELACFTAVQETWPGCGLSTVSERNYLKWLPGKNILGKWRLKSKKTTFHDFRHISRIWDWHSYFTDLPALYGWYIGNMWVLCGYYLTNMWVLWKPSSPFQVPILGWVYLGAQINVIFFIPPPPPPRCISNPW